MGVYHLVQLQNASVEILAPSPLSLLLAGELGAWWLRVLTALAESPGLDPSTHMESHNLSSRALDALFWPP